MPSLVTAGFSVEYHLCEILPIFSSLSGTRGSTGLKLELTPLIRLNPPALFRETTSMRGSFQR